MTETQRLIVADPAAVATAAAERFLAAAEEAVQRRGRFIVSLAGGATPRALYTRLAAAAHRDAVPWRKTIVFFGDERAVPPDHPESNYGMARQTLLEHVPIPPEQVHRILGEAADPEHAAASYEAVLRETFPGEPAPRFDLVLLGIGADGHTASLFPGHSALEEEKRWVVVASAPKPGPPRITLTLPALRAGRRILFLVTGEEKSAVFARAFGGVPHETPYPCELVIPTDGVREVIADRAAASAIL